MRWLRRFWRWVTGRTAAERAIRDFQTAFPGRCPVCSYWRYCRLHGIYDGKPPRPHVCPEYP